MSELVIFDSCVIIDDLRTSRHRQKIPFVTGLIRNSSVVLAELWRGATQRAERDFLHTLEKNHPILTPTEKNWLESGQTLAEIHARQGFIAEKLRRLHFDVLIALTARSHGARLITSDAADFELIRRYIKFQLEIW